MLKIVREKPNGILIRKRPFGFYYNALCALFLLFRPEIFHANENQADLHDRLCETRKQLKC